MFHRFFSLVSGNGDKPEKPHFDSRSLIFELDPCNGNGKVCLVYKHAEPGKTEKEKLAISCCGLYLEVTCGELSCISDLLCNL